MDPDITKTDETVKTGNRMISIEITELVVSCRNIYIQTNGAVN
jgi:hypothetical protein